MKRTILILLFGFILIIDFVSAAAQQPTKVFRIGYLSSFESTIDSSRSETIRLCPSWGGRLSTHTRRAKIFSSTAQISGIYTVATSQTMRKSALA